MKSSLLVSMLGLAALSGFAQGTILFNNRVAGSVVTHVYAPLATNPDLSLTGSGPWDGFTLIGAAGTAGPYGGATTFAQLLIAPGFNAPEASLVPANPIATFRTGAAAGFLQGGITVTANNVMPDSHATVEMVAWDNSSGLYPTWTQASVAWRARLIAAGESGSWNTTLGGTSTPPNLTGLQDFNLHFYPGPETSSLAMFGLGVALLLIAHRRG